MIPDELAPVLLRHLVNVSDDNLDDIVAVLALRPGADPDDPDAWGLTPPPSSIFVGVEPPDDPEVGTGYADFLAIGFINPDGSRSF